MLSIDTTELTSIFCKFCQLSVININEYCYYYRTIGSAQSFYRLDNLPPLFQSARAPFVYGGAVASAIYRFKYGQASYLGRILGAQLRCIPWPQQIDWLVPVPLHPKRLRKRGYNPAALLAKHAAWGSSVPVRYHVLFRRRNDPSQAQVAKSQRWANVQGAFMARGKNLMGRKILLIDDVLTTGSTATACTQALLQKGAAEVHLLTLAKR